MSDILPAYPSIPTDDAEFVEATLDLWRALSAEEQAKLISNPTSMFKDHAIRFALVLLQAAQDGRVNLSIERKRN